MRDGVLHVISTEMLLWSLGGFAEPGPSRRDLFVNRFTHLWLKGTLVNDMAAIFEKTPIAIRVWARRLELPRRGKGGRPRRAV